MLCRIRSVPTGHRCVLRRVLSSWSGRSREGMPRLLEKVQKGRVACEVLGLGQHSRSFEHQDNKRKPVHGAVIYHADPWTKYKTPAPMVCTDDPAFPPLEFLQPSGARVKKTQCSHSRWMAAVVAGSGEGLAGGRASEGKVRQGYMRNEGWKAG